jgi:hypothetical protein
MFHKLVWFALTVCLTAAVGCSVGSPSPVPVKGTVKTKKGQPCSNALVVFHPTEAERINGPKPVATADNDGRFVLTTTVLEDGAMPGEYSITVVWPGKSAAAGKMSLSGEGEAVGADQLKGKYGNPSQPLLKASVPSQGLPELILEVEA